MNTLIARLSLSLAVIACASAQVTLAPLEQEGVVDAGMKKLINKNFDQIKQYGVFTDANGNVKVGTTVLCATPAIVSGTSLTLKTAHNGCQIKFTANSAVSVSVPTGLPSGFTVMLLQLGSGIVAPTASGTIFLTSGSTTGVGTAVFLQSTSADNYVMSTSGQIPAIAAAPVLKGASGNGVPATAADVVSLFGGGSCSGILMSNGSCLVNPTQNLLLYSEDLTQASWATSNVTVDSATQATVSVSGSSNLRQTATVIPGGQYVFGFDAELGTLSTPKYSIYDLTHSADIVPTTSYASQVNDSTYTRVLVPFVVPAGCVGVAMYLLRDSTATGTMLFRRMQLTLVGLEKAYGTTLGSAIP